MMMSQCGCKLTLPLVRNAVVWSGSGQDAFTEVTLKEDRSCSDQVPGPVGPSPERIRTHSDLVLECGLGLGDMAESVITICFLY